MTWFHPPTTTCPKCKAKAYSAGYCSQCEYMRRWTESRWGCLLIIVVMVGLAIWNWRM